MACLDALIIDQAVAAKVKVKYVADMKNQSLLLPLIG